MPRESCTPILTMVTQCDPDGQVLVNHRWNTGRTGGTMDHAYPELSAEQRASAALDGAPVAALAPDCDLWEGPEVPPLPGNERWIPDFSVPYADENPRAIVYDFADEWALDGAVVP